MTNPYKYRAQAHEEHDVRKGDEREKALRKYGPLAVQPSGRPEFDVMDFAVNELVGLERYGEMIRTRARECLDLMEGLKPSTRHAFRDAIVIANDMEEIGERLSVELIEVRLALKAAGLHLGLTEKAAL